MQIKNSKWLLTQKATKNVYICNAKYWGLRKVMWMAKRQRQKHKSLQNIYNLMHGLEEVLKGVMQKQPKGKWESMQKCLLEFI